MASGSYFISRTADITRSRDRTLTTLLPLSTRETVAGDTRALRATSVIFTARALNLSSFVKSFTHFGNRFPKAYNRGVNLATSSIPHSKSHDFAAAVFTPPFTRA